MVFPTYQGIKYFKHFLSWIQIVNIAFFLIGRHYRLVAFDEFRISPIDPFSHNFYDFRTPVLSLRWEGARTTHQTPPTPTPNPTPHPPPHGATPHYTPSESL